MTRKKTTIDYVKSSGNVFADLGLPHPERALLLVCLDLEATGLWVGHDRIVQIAAASIFPDGSVTTWSSLVTGVLTFVETKLFTSLVDQVSDGRRIRRAAAGVDCQPRRG